MAPSAELPRRDALAARTVPVMTLSDGSASSVTSPPSVTIESNATIGAQKRLFMSGNAVVAGGAGTLGLHSWDSLLEHGFKTL